MTISGEGGCITVGAESNEVIGVNINVLPPNAKGIMD